MEQLLEQIEAYRTEINATTVSDAQATEQFRIKWLGTKGQVKSLMAEMKNVPVERKKEFGQVMNEFKLFVEGKYESFKSATTASPQATAAMDLTLPGDTLPLGTRHPISLVRNRIVSIF